MIRTVRQLLSRFSAILLLASGVPACSSTVTPSTPTAGSSLANATLGKAIPSGAQATVFVADPVANAIVEYPAGVDHPKSIGKITDGIAGPIDVAVDGFGDVYALNAAGTQRGAGLVVTAYKAGTKTLWKKLQLPTNDFGESRIAAGPDGTLYVLAADVNGPIVLEYDANATRSSNVSYIVHAVTVPPEGFGPLAIDRAGNLDIIVAAQGTALDQYDPKSQSPAQVRGSVGTTGPIAFDGAGNVLVGGGSGERAWVRIINSSGRQAQFESGPANFMSFDAVHSLLYTSFGTVSIIDYKTKTVVGSIAAEQAATGIAVSPATF